MKKKRARRERFLAEMERVVPWARLITVIEPLYPTAVQAGLGNMSAYAWVCAMAPREH